MVAADFHSGEKLTKREQITEAACRLFVDDGFDVTSMDAIAAEAQVSKRTVYSYFDNKETLFIEVMDDMCCRFSGGSADDLDFELEPRAFLKAAGDLLLSKILEPCIQITMRSIVKESIHRPEIGQKFWEIGPGRLVEALSEYIAMRAEEGVLEVDDAGLAAAQFQSMVAGPYFMPMIFTGQSRWQPEDADKIVASAVEKFMCVHEAGK